MFFSGMGFRVIERVIGIFYNSVFNWVCCVKVNVFDWNFEVFEAV